MTGDGLPTSRSLSLTHCLIVSTATHDERPRLTGAHVHGARWVEAAHTELGELAELSLLGEASRPGFAGTNRGTIGTAETSLMLAIDEDEPDTTRARRTPVPALVVAVPAARPQAPIVGQTESTGPMTPKRPLRAEVVSPPQRTSAPPPPMAIRAHTPPAPALDTPARTVDAAVRAVLAQPTSLLLPAEPAAIARPLASLARPRAKSFVAPAGARSLSFVSRLGVPVVPPPAMDTAPMARLVASSARVVVVSQSPQQRALNMAAAILSGLAAAMAVMAVAISV